MRAAQLSGLSGECGLTIAIDAVKGTATVTNSECKLVEATALKFVVHCTAIDGTLLTYIINRSTGLIVAKIPAEGVSLTGNCTRDKRMF